MSSNRFILTLRCPDARGIIHAISGALLELEGNVFEQAQYTNESTGVFVMRTRFEANTTDVIWRRRTAQDCDGFPILVLL